MNESRVFSWIVAGVVSLAASLNAPAADNEAAAIKQVITRLNGERSVRGLEEDKSYKILFNAYLELSKPPFEIGPNFNAGTIHPKMSTWSAVSGWAESNSKMAQAIVACKDKIMLGLPYGREAIEPAFSKANLVADIGVKGSLRDNQFPYLHAMDTIAAFATAEVYRLFEANQPQQALNLAMSQLFVMRQCCDREFVAEKLHAINLTSVCMSNLRDVFYLYQDRISVQQYSALSLKEIPFMRPDRNRLLMPEADRLVAEAMIREAFDPPPQAKANAERFTEMFAEIQSRGAAMERFGAAKRWRNIANIHDSLDASLARLELIYDDWWRRWRVDPYDPILDHTTEFERTNPIRFAAVVYSLRDVEQLFEIRNRLIVEVNGAAMAAGLCAFKKTYGVYPDSAIKIYTQFVRKISDSDPYDKKLGVFGYILLKSRYAIDTPEGRVWLEAGECVLSSQGQDHVEMVEKQHSDDGASGTDIIIWPPMTAVSRAQGLME